jgi:hypothetical protein
MPKLTTTHKDYDLPAFAEARAEFEAGFRRSRRGNLWRTWEGLTLTVFARDDGRYAWCIAGRAQGSCPGGTAGRVAKEQGPVRHPLKDC